MNTYVYYKAKKLPIDE